MRIKASMIFVSIAIVSATAGEALAQTEPAFEISGAWWPYRVAGYALLGEQNAQPQRFNLRHDLDLGPVERNWNLSIRWKASSGALVEAEYLTLDSESTSVPLQKAIAPFSAGSVIESRYKIGFPTLVYTYTFMNQEYMNVGLQFGAGRFGSTVRVADVTGKSVSHRHTELTPVFGVVAIVPDVFMGENIRLIAEGRMFPSSIIGGESFGFDLEGTFEWRIWDNVGLRAGWKRLVYSAEDDANLDKRILKVDFSGITLGAAVMF
ncbi:MAG: hypothetical protein NUW37_18835 [Planctomycetes bacterium]|nr:hypothetical protein [Planctomycetota bacterium]